MLVTALSALLLHEKVNASQWVAVGLGLLGVLIIVRPGGALFTPAILLPCAAATCFASYQLLTRALSSTDSPITSNFLTGIINTAVMTALVPFFWETPTFHHGLLMLVLGGFGMLSHMLMTHSFRYAAPAVLAPFSYGQLLFSGMWGYFIFDHVPDHGALIGMAIIAASGLGIAVIQGRRHVGKTA
jgi:drug/metabolite transporter (DMT)-like permease